MTALLWLIQKIAPITNLVGLLVLLSEIAYNDIGIGTHVYVLAGGLALAGFVLGFTHWALDVPPKFFWTKSRVLQRRGAPRLYILLSFLVAEGADMVEDWKICETVCMLNSIPTSNVVKINSPYSHFASEIPAWNVPL